MWSTSPLGSNLRRSFLRLFRFCCFGGGGGGGGRGGGGGGFLNCCANKKPRRETPPEGYLAVSINLEARHVWASAGLTVAIKSISWYNFFFFGFVFLVAQAGWHFIELWGNG